MHRFRGAANFSWMGAGDCRHETGIYIYIYAYSMIFWISIVEHCPEMELLFPGFHNSDGGGSIMECRGLPDTSRTCKF